MLSFFHSIFVCVPNSVIDRRTPGKLLTHRLSSVIFNSELISNDNFIRTACRSCKPAVVVIFEPTAIIMKEPLYPNVGFRAPQKNQRAGAFSLAILGLVVVFCTYFHGIGSLHILRNGDELLYAHITRVLSLSEQWLPLPGVPDLRNTKPPLLFWQGLLSTDWGNNWSPAALRLPNVLWSFATAFLCGLLAFRISKRDIFTGILAALFYLAFFTTYRYGRPFLTNPPETFWMFSCFFVMLWWKPTSFDSRFLFPTFIGLLAGMAMLTKSFAQLAPIGVGLCWWHLSIHRWRLRTFLRDSLPGLIWTALLSLSIFSLWFLLDPDPQAVWQDFVVRENVGKLESGLGSWLRGFLWDGDTVWRLAGSWFFNAGLLAFPLFGLMAVCWKHRQDLADDEKLLWIWVFAIFLVFCIPSQRSGRYLLEGMPALAVLMATRSHQLKRVTFALSLGFVILLQLALGWISLMLAREVGPQALPWWHFPLIIAVILFSLAGIFKSRWIAFFAPVAALSFFLSLSSFLSVFDAPLGAYDMAVREKTTGRVVWAPEKWHSKAETHRFLLPDAVVKGYPAGGNLPDAPVRGPNDLMVIELPIDAPAPEGALGSRINITSRHKAWQIREMAAGKVKKHLFAREWVVPADPMPFGADKK